MENGTIAKGCSRCIVKVADFFCNQCDPFNLFCSHCDGYVHSLPSKRDHNRKLIDHNRSRLKISPIKELSSPVRESNTYNNFNDDGLDRIHAKFVNDLRKTHDREKQDFITDMENIRLDYEERIKNLKSCRLTFFSGKV